MPVVRLISGFAALAYPPVPLLPSSKKQTGACCLRCSVAGEPSKQAPNNTSRPLTPRQLSLLQALQAELPSLFHPDTEGPNLDLYSPTVRFTDPLNSFVGAKRYAANIAFLRHSFVFTESRLFLHDAWAVWSDSASHAETVRTRWTLDMVANLPWRPRVAFTGTSDYLLDTSTGKVDKHIDRWDSLSSEQNMFPSPSAVLDLMELASPWQTTPDPNTHPRYLLLLRTAKYSIRRYLYPAEIQAREQVIVPHGQAFLPGSDDADEVFGKGTHPPSSSSSTPSLDSVLSGSSVVHAALSPIPPEPLADRECVDTGQTNGILVGVLKLRMKPVDLHDIENDAQRTLTSYIMQDKSSTLITSRPPRTWLTYYPRSGLQAERFEFWLELEAFNTRMV